MTRSRTAVALCACALAASACSAVLGLDDAVIDGFMITGGYASDQGGREEYGGGVSDQAEIVNCTVVRNAASADDSLWV